MEYNRNPLVSVVCQLRFHPILKVADKVSDFQDLVRSAFPEFTSSTRGIVEIDPNNTQIREEKLFEFGKADRSSKAVLSAGFLSIENKSHRNHEVLMEDFDVLTKALITVYSPVKATRLGLRYINAINKEQISEKLGRKLEWSDIIAKEFLHMPAEIADLEATLFASEITSTLSRGSLTIRFGILPNPNKEDRPPYFRVDTDRYVAGEVDTDQLLPMIDEFSKDIYSVFRSTAGPALIEWLEAP